MNQTFTIIDAEGNMREVTKEEFDEACKKLAPFVEAEQQFDKDMKESRSD